MTEKFYSKAAGAWIDLDEVKRAPPTIKEFIRWKLDTTGDSLETIWWEAQRRFPTRRITWENVLRLKNKQRKEPTP